MDIGLSSPVCYSLRYSQIRNPCPLIIGEIAAVPHIDTCRSKCTLRDTMDIWREDIVIEHIPEML